MDGMQEEKMKIGLFQFPRSFLPEAHPEEGNRTGTQRMVYEHER